MKVIKVTDKASRHAFLRVPKLLYRDEGTWVCPLDKEIESIFDPKKNVYFSHGEASRWILEDEQGNLAGRIAAFIDQNTAQKQDQPTGGIGFFECIKNQEAANQLFDTAREWLKERGMEAMDGPVNFGETDKYWGLLVDGFTHPSYEIAYNFPYYQELFETYGFQTYFKQEGFHLDITEPLPPRFQKIAEWISRKPDYEFKHFSWKDSDKFVKDFVTVFNEAWASFKENFEPLEVSYIKKTMEKARAIIDEEFVWIAYNKGKPIAIYMMYPDVNQILKHLDGRMNLPSMLKFLYLKKRKTMTRTRGVLMGVIPAFQGMGVEAAIILQLVKVFERKSHYTEIEFSWVGDFNPRMRKIFIGVGCKSVKHYITYRYLFDREKPFKRYPIPVEKEEKSSKKV
ncbi:MAG: GNAT family N-acetyltransferase [Bacteroidetes bacterium]|nr:GNAT family N-acetyltransferase [Bacteroidota bacterium]